MPPCACVRLLRDYPDYCHVLSGERLKTIICRRQGDEISGPSACLLFTGDDRPMFPQLSGSFHHLPENQKTKPSPLVLPLLVIRITVLCSIVFPGRRDGLSSKICSRMLKYQVRSSSRQKGPRKRRLHSFRVFPSFIPYAVGGAPISLILYVTNRSYRAVSLIHRNRKGKRTGTCKARFSQPPGPRRRKLPMGRKASASFRPLPPSDSLLRWIQQLSLCRMSLFSISCSTCSSRSDSSPVSWNHRDPCPFCHHIRYIFTVTTGWYEFLPPAISSSSSSSERRRSAHRPGAGPFRAPGITASSFSCRPRSFPFPLTAPVFQQH